MGIHSLWILFNRLCQQAGWITIVDSQSVMVGKRSCRLRSQSARFLKCRTVIIAIG